MPTDSEPRDPFLADLHRRSEAIVGRAGALTAGMSDDAFHRAPPGGGWSVGQIFEHLCIGNGSYVEPLRAVLAANPPRVAEPRPWKKSFIGGLIRATLDPANVGRRKFSAPRIYRPGQTPRPNVVAEFQRMTRELDELARSADGVELGRARFVSPVSPLIRMNLADALAIPVIHSERHLIQIERTRSAVGA